MSWRPDPGGKPWVCVLEAGHALYHCDATGQEWIASPGLEAFDAYCAEHDISAEEAPAAFAAWLNEESGWDGQVRLVEGKDGAS